MIKIIASSLVLSVIALAPADAKISKLHVYKAGHLGLQGTHYVLSTLNGLSEIASFVIPPQGQIPLYALHGVGYASDKATLLIDYFVKRKIKSLKEPQEPNAANALALAGEEEEEFPGKGNVLNKKTLFTYLRDKFNEKFNIFGNLFRLNKVKIKSRSRGHSFVRKERVEYFEKEPLQKVSHHDVEAHSDFDEMEDEMFANQS